MASLQAQVGVNTTSPSPAAALDISSSNKGFLMPRIALTGTDDNSTIKPAATTGLMVYNTATVSTGSNKISPGFYYWGGSSWRRLFNQGYNLRYNQTSEVRASSSYTSWVDLPGLDTGNLTIPYSGVYQIFVKAYLTAGDRSGGASGDGATQGSIRLTMAENGSSTFTPLKETYITSSSKDIDGVQFYNLGQAAFIVWNIELDSANTYRFKIEGREWHTSGVERGWFGKETNGYAGANGVNNAQMGSMSISIVKQM